MLFLDLRSGRDLIYPVITAHERSREVDAFSRVCPLDILSSGDEGAPFLLCKV